MKLFVRIRYSHALRFVPSWKPANPRYARRTVSCTRSSASAGLRVIRSADEYRPESSGITSRSKRARRAGSSSVGACWAVDTPSTVHRVGENPFQGASQPRRPAPAATAAVPALPRGCHISQVGGKMLAMADNGNNRRGLGGDGQGGPGMPRPKFSPWLTIPILLLILIVFNSVISNVNTSSIDYSEFTNLVEEGKIVGTITISSSDISGTFQAGDQQTAFSTQLSPNFQADQEFRTFLDTNSVQYKFTQPSVLTSLLINILPFALVMLLVYFFIFRRMGGGAAGALNLGKNKVKVYDRKEMK